MPEIYQMLHQDHEKVRQMMSRLRNEADGGEQARRDLFEQVRQELMIHTQFEEETFYPAVRERGGKQADKEVEHAYEEHKEAKQMLDEIASMDIQSDDFIERIEKLADALDEHIQEEEQDIFRDARSVIDESDAAQLGEAYESFKQQHKA